MNSYMVRCRSCGTQNRVPADKEGVPGDCGNCKGVLPSLYWRPQQVNEKNFDTFISQYDGPVIAEFWAPW